MKKAKFKQIIIPVCILALTAALSSCSKLSDKGIINNTEANTESTGKDSIYSYGDINGDEENTVLEDFTGSEDDTDVSIIEYTTIREPDNYVDVGTPTQRGNNRTNEITTSVIVVEGDTTPEDTTKSQETVAVATGSDSSEGYTLTFITEKGGKTFKTMSGSKSYAIPDDVPKKTGYVFSGWKSSSDGKIYESGDSITITKNTTMTGQWNQTYVLSFDTNGGTGTYKRLSGKCTYTIPDDVPTKDGYTFYGWKSSSDNKEYYPGDTITITKATTLKAQWGKSGSKIIFNLSGGSGTFNPMSGKMTYVLPEEEPTRAGYVFLGWKSSKDDKTYQAGESIVAGDTVTLTALWKKYYTLTFDLNGGTGNFEALAYDTTYTLPTSKPSRSGYTFTGWKAPDGTIYKAGKEITLTENITVSAVWIKSNSNIIVDS